MADTIRGSVTSVTDGDTFTMKITHTGADNEYEYNDTETVRIAGIDAPELNTDAGKKAKKDLEDKLSAKEVRVTVQARDNYRRVVGTIEML